MTKINEMKKFRRVNVALAAVVMAATIGAVASPAGAVVQNNGVNRAYSNVGGTGCQVVVGDQQTADGGAVGEVDVTRCVPGTVADLRVEAELWYGPNKVTAEQDIRWHWLDFGRGALQGDVSTLAAGEAYGFGYWTTVAFVSFNGGVTWTEFTSAAAQPYNAV